MFFLVQNHQLVHVVKAAGVSHLDTICILAGVCDTLGYDINEMGLLLQTLHFQCVKGHISFQAAVFS